MNKLIRLTVIIAILSLTSFKSYSQVWGDVLSQTTNPSYLALIQQQNPSGTASQLLNANGSAYVVSYSQKVGSSIKTYNVYFYSFYSGGVYSYFSATQQVGGTGYTVGRETSSSIQDQIGAPIDGGVSLLLVGGVALHLRRKKKLSTDSEAA
jgi:hypothetical protein